MGPPRLHQSRHEAGKSFDTKVGGGGTHTGPRFDDFLMVGPPAGSGRTLHITGTSVLTVTGGKIVEEAGLDDGVTALVQLGFILHPLTPS